MTRENVVTRAKKLSKWFELDIVIKIFGVVIFQWHYPPEENPNEAAEIND